MAQPSNTADFKRSIVGLDRQNKEFDALTKLAEEWTRLRNVPVVDDYYPEARHAYESALKTFITALEANRRLPVSMITATKSLTIDATDIAKIIGTTPSPIDTEDINDHCDRACERPGGGTCICAELSMDAATRVVAYVTAQLKRITPR